MPVLAGDGHLADQYRTGTHGTAHVHIAAHSDDVAEYVLEVAGDGDLLHRVDRHAVLHPEAGSAPGVITGHAVHPLAQELGDHETPTHALQQTRVIQFTRFHDEVAHPARVAG